MFELIYPDEPAPLVPAPDAASAVERLNPSTAFRAKEFFPVIDEGGFVTGMAARAYCHSGAKVLHPVVHLHVMDRYGRLWLQKRSERKDIQPGKWDTAVGGHVDYGESIMEALYREAGEELGFTGFNPIYVDRYVFESEVEKEMINVFAAIGDFKLHPDEDEVDEIRLWTRQEIEESFGKSVFTPNFEKEFVRIIDKLTALL